MSVSNKIYCISYAHAAGLIKNSESKYISCNKKLIRNADRSISLSLWGTDVVIYNPEGSITLRTGGYETVTTKKTIRKYSNHNLYTIDGVLCVNGYVFHEGITLNSVGQDVGHPEADQYSTYKLKERLDLDKALEYDGVNKILAGLDYKKVKNLIRNRYIRDHVLEHCNKSILPLFINDEWASKIIAKRFSQKEIE
jgi:hypothetical protein